MHFLKLIPAVMIILLAPVSFADDKVVLNQLLNNFLANSVNDDLKNHSLFWADDLVYTSSSGSRFNKSVIINGIKESATKSNNDEPTYWAEDTDIRLYGTTAIVAFKLVAKWQEEGIDKHQFYYNTGTFLKRDGQWQATKVPQE